MKKIYISLLTITLLATVSDVLSMTAKQRAEAAAAKRKAKDAPVVTTSVTPSVTPSTQVQQEPKKPEPGKGPIETAAPTEKTTVMQAFQGLVETIRTKNDWSQQQKAAAFTELRQMLPVPAA